MRSESPSPRKSPGPEWSARWRTDRRLRVVALKVRGDPPAEPLPEAGSVIPKGRNRTRLADGVAHLHALAGSPYAYRRKLGGRVYDVRVAPRFGRGKKIVGVQATLRILPGATPGDEPAGRQHRRSLELSVQLARTLAATAHHAAEVRNRKLRELQRVTEQALHRTEADERRARFLADASLALEYAPDLDRALDRVGKILLQHIADWWVLQLREGDTLRLAAFGARDAGPREALRRALPERAAASADDFRRLSRPAIYPSSGAAELADVLHGFRRARFPATARGGSLLRVPVLLHGQLVGVLVLAATASSAPFDHPDKLMAEDLGSRIALYVETLRGIARRREVEERLIKFNAELEQRVYERTRLLEDANREANSFAYTVAHDLRAPLRAITGFGQVLLEDYAGLLDVPGRDILDRIIAAARRMDELIRDLLEYSRLNRAEISTGVVDLDVLLPRTMLLLDREREERGAVVEWAAPLGRVIAQEVLLSQALRNLLSNAMKFVSRGTRPEVRVSTEPRGGRIRIVVEDNGIGIAPEHQGRVFGMFERLNAAEDYPGTGMGLAIVRRAIERLGGQVGVESEPGNGSRFWIELPGVDGSPR